MPSSALISMVTQSLRLSRHGSLVLLLFIFRDMFLRFGGKIALFACTLIHYYIKEICPNKFLFLHHLIEVQKTLERFMMQTEARSCTSSSSNEADKMNNGKRCKCA